MKKQFLLILLLTNLSINLSCINEFSKWEKLGLAVSVLIIARSIQLYNETKYIKEVEKYPVFWFENICQDCYRHLNSKCYCISVSKRKYFGYDVRPLWKRFLNLKRYETSHWDGTPIILLK